MWKARKQKSICSQLLSNKTLLLCTLFINAVQCDGNILLNFCCPEGSDYDLENDKCIESGMLLKNVALSENGDGISAPAFYGSGGDTNKTYYSINSEDAGSDSLPSKNITLPKRLVLDLRKGNQTEFSFPSNLNFPTTAWNCTEGKFMVVLNVAEDVEKETGGNTNSQSNNTTGSPPLPQTPIRFTSNGQLRIENDYYSSPEFCIAGLQNELLTIRVCNATCSGETPCIRKCCDLKEVWNLQRKTKGKKQICVPAGENTWEPEFYKYPEIKATPEERRAIFPHYKIIHPLQFCKNYPIKQSIEQKDENGRIYWKFRINMMGQNFRRTSRYTWIDKEFSGPYCLDGAVNSKFLTGEDQTGYSGLREDEIIFICSEGRPKPGREQSALYAVLMILSCFFLLLTILVHIILYDKQPNRAWTLTLLSYATSLFFLYLVFALMHISGFYVQRSNEINYFCYSIGVGVNFFFLSTFCWMSAVNFDIFRTFKVLKPTSGRAKGLRQYLIYAVFSLTVPIVIVAIGIVMDNLYRYDYGSGIIVPEYGKSKCNLDPEYAQLVYTYGPAGVLLIFNVICFIITIYTMHKIQKSTKFATATSSKSKKHQQEQSLKLFAKLVFVMGVPWIFEIISWYTEKEKESGNSWYWLLTDVLNIFQAMAIFWIFVCKPDVIRQLEQKYPRLQQLLDRLMLDSESAQKITDRHPKLKRFVKAFTRKGKETSSSATRSGGQTDSSVVSTANSPSNLEMSVVEK